MRKIILDLRPCYAHRARLDLPGTAVKQGAVVYCAFEGQVGIDARKTAFEQKFLSDDRQPVPLWFEMVTLDLVNEHPDLIESIKELVGGVVPATIVLDTLNKSLNGSENKDEDMTAYVKAAEALVQAFGCAVIVVHHCGVNGNRPRGHSSLTGACDAQLAVHRDASKIVVVKVEYMKDGPDGDVITNRLEQITVGEDEDGDELTSKVVVPVEGEPKSVKPKKKGPKLTPAAKTALRALREAADALGVTAPTSNYFPPKARVVTTEQWRTYAYKLGISTGGERAQQTAFQRGTKLLIDERLVGVSDGLHWLIETR